MTVVVIMMTTLSQFQGLPSVAAVLSGCRGSSFYALSSHDFWCWPRETLRLLPPAFSDWFENLLAETLG